MDTPHFPEAQHPIVASLAARSDLELLDLFQRYPDSGRYFVALFCRYSPIVYTLARHATLSPVQTDYLFAKTWQRIFRELTILDLRLAQENLGGSANLEEFTLQNWLINITAVCVNQAELPSVESIHYSLSNASPPLWCYLENALDRQEPMTRLMTIMAQTLHWSEPRIAAYLQAEGETISPAGVRARLRQGYRAIQESLPPDIRAIYLGEPLATADAIAAADLSSIGVD